MKRLIIWLEVLFSCQLGIIYAQNLVPNGSFENYSQCPSTANQIYFATGWFQPHKYPGNNSVNQSSSSDYFNSCYFVNSGQGVPNNSVGFQTAKTGNAYIGIIPYSFFANGNAYREYAEIMLEKELVANKKYILKYFISMANLSLFSITKFDAYLSNDSLLYTSPNLYKIPVNPQIQYNGRINDTLNWIEVTGNYTAVGGERFLTLGNFQDGFLCDSLRTNVTTFLCCYAYYYIDDVSLELDTLTSIEENTIANFQLFPNPAPKNICITSPQIIQELSVFDYRNKILLKQMPRSTAARLDLIALEDGIYIVECKFKNGAVRYKKLVLQKE